MGWLGLKNTKEKDSTSLAHEWKWYVHTYHCLGPGGILAFYEKAVAISQEQNYSLSSPLSGFSALNKATGSKGPSIQFPLNAWAWFTNYWFDYPETWQEFLELLKLFNPSVNMYNQKCTRSLHSVGRIQGHSLISYQQSSWWPLLFYLHRLLGCCQQPSSLVCTLKTTDW